jgi:hypothetical protein
MRKGRWFTRAEMDALNRCLTNAQQKLREQDFKINLLTTLVVTDLLFAHYIATH